MAEFSRRDMLSAAAAGSVAAAATSTDDVRRRDSRRSGPTPPVLAGTELPSFRFQLGAVAPKTVGRRLGEGGDGRGIPGLAEARRRADVAGRRAGCASCTGTPTRAEWAYVIKGPMPRHHHRPAGPVRRSSTSAPATSGTSRAGTAIRSRASAREDCLFVLVFDNGYFSEFGTFSISDWIRHTPPRCWRRTSACRRRPSRISPSARSTSPRAGAAAAAGRSRARRAQQRARSPIATACWRNVRETYPGGTNRLVSQREFPDLDHHHRRAHAHQAGRPARAALASQRRRMAVLHRGRARMSVFGSNGRVRTEEFNAGDVGYVPQGYGHYIENTGSEDLELLIVLNNGTYRSISLTAWIGANPAPPAGDQFRGAGEHVQGLPHPRAGSCRGEVRRRAQRYEHGIKRCPLRSCCGGRASSLRTSSNAVDCPVGQGSRIVDSPMPHALSVSSTRSGVNGKWRSRLPVSR